MLRSHEKLANEPVDRAEAPPDHAERSLGEQSKKILRDVRDRVSLKRHLGPVAEKRRDGAR